MKQLADVEILLINNSITDIELIVHTLQKVQQNGKLVQLGSGEEGLDFIFGRGNFYNRGKRKFPKLVLLDLAIPGINGIEVLRHIKANEITRVIPVVVFTSCNEEKDIINSYHLAVNSFVIKPTDTAAFVSIIQQLVTYWLLINHSPVITE